MPYVNPYSTSLPGVDEARLLALQSMIVASLSDLNASLARDSASPMTPFTSGQILIGDPETVTQSLICVVGGGKNDATDMEAGRAPMKRTDTDGPGLTLYTNLYVYLHRNEMLPADDSPLTYVQYMEIARSRICDHLRKRVFNAAAGAVINLTSSEYVSTGTDQMGDCKITKISKMMYQKGSGDSIWIYGAHLLHEGIVGWYTRL